MNLTVYALGAGTAVALLALTRRSNRGGHGDDASTAAGRTYGANPEPDDGGAQLEEPVWQDHLTHDPALDEELPRGIAPRPRDQNKETE